ncbi:MAG: multi-sensor hybrid histidine kinase [Ignavibacteria bacterium]|nr:MAG: multi-sensor hybrid histidine kinase [Ignavibacteria bacterium]KAF0161860.1 MAG: multi-sensor hybrid histidine kinase [Ignavibacteria bacterium]
MALQKTKNSAEIRKYAFFAEESKKSLLAPFQALAKFTSVAGLIAMVFEIRHFTQFQNDKWMGPWIYGNRLSAILIAFILLIFSYTKFGKKHPVVLVHILLLAIVSSFGLMIYLIPETIIFNSQLISLIIFVAALFLSWDVANQIIVAIYYNLVFAVSILMSTREIFIMPNMVESVVLVITISVLAIVASYINYKLRHEAVIKNFEISISEKKYRTLVENSAEGIFQFNSEGRFLTVNPTLVKLLGFSAEDEIKNFSLKKDLFKRSGDWELLNKLLEKQGKVRNYRVPFLKKDGNEITVRMNVRINDDDENVQNIYEGSLHDITQQVHAEVEKQKALDALRLEKMKADTLAKKAQQESHFKTKFLASMSHEVRTPMNSVMGFLTLIENDLFESKEELKGFSRDARLAAESLLDIINSILDISKVEAGKMELDEVGFDVRHEVNKALSIIGQSVKTKGLSLESHLDETIPETIYGDPTRFRQILINLLNNAIKFTDYGKVVVEIKTKAKDSNFIELLVTISDTGAGIPSDKLNLLFEPFTQIKGKKSAKEGSGLGLMIVKEFVRLMNGDIKVESKVGFGSKFIFTLKMKLYPSNFTHVEEGGESKHLEESLEIQDQNAHKKIIEEVKKKRLLLVEDNPISQNLEAKILREVGYEVEAVSSGIEAIECVKTGSFNLVLMDVEMTEMDGITATQKIRELPAPYSKIPIIAVTARSSMKDRERCLNSGMDDYIAKPINIHFLKITIDQWLNAKHQ